MNELTLDTIQLFLSQLADNSDSVYWLGDPEFTNLAYVSPVFEQIWGRSRQLLYDNPSLWITYLHPDDRERHPILEMKARVAKDKAAARFKEIYRIVKPDGSIRWILDRGFAVCNSEGDCVAVTGVAVDITEEKEIEQLKIALQASQVASRAKSEFIQNMSHDLRTPLTGLLGISESQTLFLDDDDPDKDNYRLICDSARQLHRMFENILETAGLDYRNSVDQPVPFSIDTVVNNVVALLKPSLLHKQLDWTVEPLGTLPQKALMGHPLMLERVLMNLLGNAIKFTDEGTVTVQYGVTQDNTATLWLTLMVKDSGQGIPLDKQTEIFELFTRVSPSYEGLHGGYGLGLYITKKLVTLMGGTITADSKGENKGATFTCTLPVTLTDQSPKPLMITTQSRAEVQYQQSTWKSEREEQVQTDDLQEAAKAPICFWVLLVEDNLIAARVASLYLQRQQCEVTVAKTAKEALSLAEHRQYDCIFMDVGLPDGDGREITQTIRSTPTFANTHTPIIGLTAHADTDIQQACLAAGMNMVYCKPLNPERVRTVLNDIVVHPASAAPNKQQKENSTAGQASQSTPPVIDLATSAQLLQCDEQAVKELLDQFMTALKTDKTQLDEAFNRSDADRWKMLNTLIHRIRGACGYCGALLLQQGCANFETHYYAEADEATLTHDYQAIMTHIEELENHYQNPR